MKEPKYKRILLKLSGESLSTDGEVIDPTILGQYAAEIKKVHDLGVEVFFLLAKSPYHHVTVFSGILELVSRRICLSYVAFLFVDFR